MRKWLKAAAVMASTTGCSGQDSAEIPAGGAGSTGTNVPDASTCTAMAASSPLRRLTRLEYANTVRDLLGLELAPADAFPVDAIAGGFNNNAALLTISPLLAEKYMEAAEALAAEAALNLPALLPCDPAAIGESACAQQFVEHFGRRAYRRPLGATERDRLLRAYAAGRELGSFASGVELVVQTVLQSPGFLYRFEFGSNPATRSGLVALTQHELATRLSYLLWSSMPDDALAAAADAGTLVTPEAIATRARVMMDDPRARSAVAEFYRQWLGLGALDTIRKDPELYPELDLELRAAMAAELPAFVGHVLWSADRKLSTLLTAPLGFPLGPLATLYGVSPSREGGPVMLDPAERVGVLTQAAVLAVHALPNQSSPVARGKFVRERLLCQQAPPPPADLNVTPPEVDASRSTRERFAQHTESVACSVCHELMDPLGFAFESYDALGRFRTTDGGRTIDTAGWIVESDIDGPFQNVRELGNKLAASKQVGNCVATQWFRYAFGRFEGPADTCSLDELEMALERSGGDLYELLISLTQTEAFRSRRALGPDEVAP